MSDTKDLLEFLFEVYGELEDDQTASVERNELREKVYTTILRILENIK